MRFRPRAPLGWLLAVAAAVASGCLTSPARTGDGLPRAEESFAHLRTLKDGLDVARARGAASASLADAARAYREARGPCVASLAAAAASGPEDARALDLMRKAVERDLPLELEPAEDSAPGTPDPCAQGESAPASVSRAQLSERLYACFGNAARRIVVDGETLDRLSILGLLPRTEDAERRHRLFLALEPVFRAVNGDDGPKSPYRALVRLGAPGWAPGDSPPERSMRALGLDAAALEPTLVSILEAWRRASPDETVEPWDFAYASGKASRLLGPRAPLERLASIAGEAYAALGADPARLGTGFDLAPRDGKTPVAYTTFGSRGDIPTAWVFATYRAGGFDSLEELLHEIGHAVHISAIRTRPAFRDWPDDDAFTEALGDLLALEAYEPAWQERYLHASVPVADAMRAKYAGIVLDVAWALFELRMHRDPTLDPNGVWTDLTSRYLRVVPHPELSWWAVRGQLVHEPGYMANYAIGAILAADLRARAAELYGPLTPGDTRLYSRLSERIYRFGLERTSRRVLEDFLGRAPSPAALLTDMGRARVSSPAK